MCMFDFLILWHVYMYMKLMNRCNQLQSMSKILYVYSCVLCLTAGCMFITLSIYIYLSMQMHYNLVHSIDAYMYV